MTMTDRPALAAIWTSRSRSFPVGMAADGAPEVPAAPAARGPAAGPFPSFGAGFGEVEVLDDDRAGAAGLRSGDQGADGGAQVPVAGGGRQPGQVQADGGRGTQDVAVRRDDRSGEVAVIDVDSHHRARPQLVQGLRGARGGLPRGVDVPAASRRVVADVVADGAAGRLGGNLIAPVAERDWGRQPVAAVRPVRQTSERGRELDLQPARRPGCQRIVSFPHALAASPSAVRNSRADSHCSRHWASVRPARGQAAALAQQRLPASDHGYRSRLQLPLYPGQPGLQQLEANGLGVPLGGGRIAANPAGPAARRDRQPGLDPADAGLQARPLRRAGSVRPAAPGPRWCG